MEGGGDGRYDALNESERHVFRPGFQEVENHYYQQAKKFKKISQN
jgi:hypothetical protein